MSYASEQRISRAVAEAAEMLKRRGDNPGMTTADVVPAEPAARALVPGHASPLHDADPFNAEDVARAIRRR